MALDIGGEGGESYPADVCPHCGEGPEPAEQTGVVG
jgi:hypothetical protein